ncbi:hypothetical protein [Rubrivivax gelatinosus]|uniref:Lipoprotein n=1 Tax=Rubrivivax gelatinosus TaxID=28068 RepID=A0A4R2MT90_RUBGE|nr:hypothetical protein [Rubrivivax gelatinosus]MBK1687298.1 hypothetical protein [Rubrivivax gelatinosus]TCP02703.1 hypothetical protein EV684_106265 [Rubrivivax gelatinosus]
MKTAPLSIALALAATGTQAAPSAQDASDAAAQAATRYAQAVSCTEDEIPPERVATLRPYRDDAAREHARYAVVWHGDLGCRGGSGSDRARLAIVVVGTGDSFVVDPGASSPAVRLEMPVRWVETIRALGPERLRVEGLAHAPGDAACCPSRRRSFTLQRQPGGQWTTLGRVTETAADSPDGGAPAR